MQDLTAAECLRLRDEAAYALPKLRAMLATTLREPRDRTAAIGDVVNELRAQVADVEQEIATSKGLAENRYRIAMEGLSLAFVLYGLASSVPPVAAAGLGALLASLAHAQQGSREQANREQRIVTTPGFALVKAREILNDRAS